jgi:hypothetical protein
VNVTLLPPGLPLVDEVARRLEQPGVPLADAHIVFPGKRPAHFLRRKLAQKAGASFIPPRIQSMDELVDSIFDAQEERQGRVLPKLELLDAVAILYDIQIAAAQPLGGTGFMTLDSFFPLGTRIYNDLEELSIEGVSAHSVADVQPLVEEEVPPRSRERLLALAHFYTEFYRVVEDKGFSTRSSRYRQAVERLAPEDLPGSGPFILAGFCALTQAERMLFRSLGEWPRVQIIVQEGEGLREIMKGFALPSQREETPKPPRPDTRFYSSPEAHGQVFALNAALGSPDEGTLIVLPRPDTLFPLLRHCLSRFEPESYNVSLPYPLQRTPLYGFLNNLMELVGTMDGERVYLAAYVAFALHPYVKNIRLGQSAEATRVLFHALEERLATERTRRFATLEEIESDNGLFDEAARRIGEGGPGETVEVLRAHLVDIHGRTIHRFRSFTSVRDFAEQCIELISWVHDQSTARDHPYFTPFSEAFMRSLEAISRSLMAGLSFNDTGSYFALLRRYLATCYLPFPGTPLHGLQVLGALETRNLHFDRIFVLDANEGSLPESSAESTLLPFSVRKSLGLPTYQDREDVSAYHFGQLAAGARELHLFSLASGEAERSRFVERLLWERQKEESIADDAGFVHPIRYRVTLANAPPPPVAKTPAVVEWLRTRTYSATSLDAYLRCPLRFYYQVVLNLGEREETTGDIEAVDIGLFVHDVLFRYFMPRTARPLLQKDLNPDELAALVDTMFEKRFGSAESGANRLLRNQIRRHLCDFLTGYMSGLVKEHRVTIASLEHGIETLKNGFRLRGRLDAVESRDGRTVLIDYKSSAHRSSYTIRMKKLVPEDRTTWSKAIPTLQLPLYVLLHASETEMDPRDVQAMFLLLGRTEMNEQIEAPLFEDTTDARSSWPVLEGVIFGLLSEIISPDVHFTPAPDLKSACPRCPFTGICGTGWLQKG